MEDYGDRYFMGYDLNELKIDQFYLTVTSDYQPFNLFQKHRDCVECPYLRDYYYDKKIANTIQRYKISASTGDQIYENDTDLLCDLDKDFGEFGIYNVTIENNTCTIDTLKDPVNIYFSLLTVAGIYILLGLIVWACIFVYKRQVRSKKEVDGNSIEQAAKKPRISSIDTFRGITIALMIFVNYGGGQYYFINHATWNGLHLADLAFPWFIWIMGACIPISLTSSFKKGTSNETLMKTIFMRSLKLFCLGIFLGGGTDLQYLRIFGVLQRFGISYFVVATICVLLMNRSLEQNQNHSFLNHFTDILKLIKGWIAAFAILILYIIILMFASKPGCPKRYLGPGGLHKNMQYLECVGGITGYVDETILGKHSYQNPTISEVFQTRAFDPEGILGCMPTIFHVFLGVQAGTTLLVYKNHYQRLVRWLAWAVITGLIGGALCGISKEDGLIPVNKNLWSISYVMVTTCFALVVISFCYIMVDVTKWWSGKPFLFAGMNAILMYIGHEAIGNHFPIRWIAHEHNPMLKTVTHFWLLIYDVWSTGAWICIAYYLYRIKYFFTI